MTTIRVSRRAHASPETCWSLLGDFANMHVFNPHLSRSALLEQSPATGVGCERQCSLKGSRGYMRERVIDWQEGRSYTVDVYDSTLPLADTITTIGVEPESSGDSCIFMQTDYRPRGGLFAASLDLIVTRHIVRSGLAKVLDGLAAKAEHSATRKRESA